MLGKIVPQVEGKVKCDVEGCHEPQFRASGLCFNHFIAEQTALWDDQDAERRAALEGVGYIWAEEVLA